MDPNQALKNLRAMVETALRAGAGTSEGLQEMAEQVDALDTWLKAGGALPTDWDPADAGPAHVGLHAKNYGRNSSPERVLPRKPPGVR